MWLVLVSLRSVLIPSSSRPKSGACTWCAYDEAEVRAVGDRERHLHVRADVVVALVL